MAVKAGKTYRIGVWVKFAGTGVTSHMISMEYFGSQQGKESLKFSGSTDWEYQQILFTPLQACSMPGYLFGITRRSIILLTMR